MSRFNLVPRLAVFGAVALLAACGGDNGGASSSGASAASDTPHGAVPAEFRKHCLRHRRISDDVDVDGRALRTERNRGDGDYAGNGGAPSADFKH